MYHYIRNGKPFASTERLFYFEWTYNEGGVTFGMFGTEDQYRSADLDDSWRRILCKKELLEEAK